MMRGTLRTALPLLAAAIFAGVAGCKSHPEPVAGPPDDVEVYPKVTLESPDMAERIGIQQPILTKTAAGNLVVTLTVRSRTSSDSAIDHRIVWLDEFGAVIKPDVAWRYQRLVTRQPERLTYTATNPRAVDYNIQLKWSQK